MKYVIKVKNLKRYTKAAVRTGGSINKAKHTPFYFLFCSGDVHFRLL